MGSAGSMPATGTAQKDTGRAGPARDDGWPAPCAEALPSNPHFTDEENQGSECDLSQDASRWLRLPLGCVCIDCIYNQFSHLGPHLWLWALLTGAVPSCSPSSLRSQRLNPPPVWWRPLHAFLGGGGCGAVLVWHPASPGQQLGLIPAAPTTCMAPGPAGAWCSQEGC